MGLAKEQEQHYMLVSQSQPQIEVFSKTANGGWVYQRFDQLGDVVFLNQMDIQLGLEQVYEGVVLEEQW